MFSQAEHEQWLRELYAAKPEPKPTDISAGVFEKYLAEQNVCRAGVRSAHGKSFSDFYKTSTNSIYLLAGLRVAAAKLIGKPSLYDIAEIAFKCGDLAKAHPRDDAGFINPNDGEVGFIAPGKFSDQFFNQAMYCMGEKHTLFFMGGRTLSFVEIFSQERIAEILQVNAACCDLIRNSKIITF